MNDTLLQVIDEQLQTIKTLRELVQTQKSEILKLKVDLKKANEEKTNIKKKEESPLDWAKDNWNPPREMAEKICPGCGQINPTMCMSVSCPRRVHTWYQTRITDHSC